MDGTPEHRRFEWASGKRALAALGTLLIGGFLLFQLGPYAEVKRASESPLLPEETITSPAALTEFLKTLDPPTQDAYARFQLWDLMNLALFGTMGVFVLAWLLRVAMLERSALRWMLILPIAVVVFDVAENVVLAVAIASFPEVASSNAALPWITGAKFIATLFMFAAMILGGAVATVRQLRRPPRSV